MPQLTVPAVLALLRAAAQPAPVALVTGRRPELAEEMLADCALEDILEKHRLEDLATLVCALLG